MSGRLRVLMPLMLLTAAFAVVGVGCGSDDDDGGGSGAAAQTAEGGSGESAAVEKAYDQFIANVYGRQYPQACALFTTGYEARYPKENRLAKTCVGTMRREFVNLPDVSKPRLIRVKLHGPASATGFSVTDDPKNPILVGFEKEQGDWRLNGAAKEDEE